MKKKDVQIGATYLVKVSGKLQNVKIMRESIYGGWDGLNDRTGRAVRIATAGKLRKLICPALPTDIARPTNVLEQSLADARKTNEEFELDQLSKPQGNTLVIPDIFPQE